MKELLDALAVVDRFSPELLKLVEKVGPSEARMAQFGLYAAKAAAEVLNAFPDDVEKQRIELAERITKRWLDKMDAKFGGAE